MNDEVAQYNMERWEALVKVNALFTRPELTLDAATACPSDHSDFYPDPTQPPATGGHFTAFAPPWLHFWTLYRPDLEEEANSP